MSAEARKWTPGPWQSCSGQDGKCTCGQVWSLPGDFPVFTARHYVGEAHTLMADDLDMVYAAISAEQARTNANLIAAAPELYEALAALQLQALQSSVNDGNEYGCEALALARAALAKARGEQP